MCPLFAYAGYATARAPVEAKKKRDLSSFHTYTVFLSLGWVGGVTWSKKWFKTVFITFLYSGSQSSGQNKEKQRYIIPPHICSVSQLILTLPSLIARSLYTHNMYAHFYYAGYAAVRASVEKKKNQDVSSLHTYAGYAAAWAPVELKKNKMYHSSTHTQCFSAKALPCILC